jgi:L-fuconolactonase
MPDGPLVDAHVHLWDPRQFRMPWLDDDPHLLRRFGLDEFARDTAEVVVDAAVYLQVDVTPAYGLLEARWAVQQAERAPRLRGIVAWAPLEDGPVARSYLEALVQLGPRIKGVRRLIQSETDPDFPVRRDFVEGLRLLPGYGLSFDICIRHHQLARTVEMVRACPETSFILDHLGKPDVRAHRLDPWRTELAELADLPNVVCKLSGLVTEADHEQWTAADLAPYVEHALRVFGEDRVLFGGDWPVVTHAATYKQWVQTLDQLTAGLSAEASRKLWSHNARRVYRL